MSKASLLKGLNSNHLEHNLGTIGLIRYVDPSHFLVLGTWPTVERFNEETVQRMKVLLLLLLLLLLHTQRPSLAFAACTPLHGEVSAEPRHEASERNQFILATKLPED